MVFLGLGLYLRYIGWWKAEVAVEMLTSLFTSCAVIVSLGSGMMRDALQQYESSPKRWITNLRNYLDDIKVTVDNPRQYASLCRQIRQITTPADREIESLLKYGKFFFTRLYPHETIKDAKKNS